MANIQDAISPLRRVIARAYRLGTGSSGGIAELLEFQYLAPTVQNLLVIVG
jgi:hypothetical protein